jgi:hypothetical protein
VSRKRRGGRAPARDGGGNGGPRGGNGNAAAGGWLRELAALALDRARWEALDEDTLLVVVFQQVLYWAHTQDVAAASALAELYPFVAERVARADRLELLDRVIASVEEGTPVSALLPFLQHEPDPDAVSLAAQSFATLAPAEGGDELAGPRALVRMAEHAEDEGTKAGLLAGLLQLGDRRLLPLLLAGWASLPPGARERLAAMKPASPMLFAGTPEFWLGALEHAEGDETARIAGVLAALPASAEPHRVLDVRRKLPANAPDDREEIEVLADVSIAAYAERLAPRLRAAAERAGDAGAALRAAWGLG